MPTGSAWSVEPPTPHHCQPSIQVTAMGARWCGRLSLTAVFLDMPPVFDAAPHSQSCPASHECSARVEGTQRADKPLPPSHTDHCHQQSHANHCHPLILSTIAWCVVTRGDKVLSEDASLIENYYAGWTIDKGFLSKILSPRE